ncbi:MAG: response regulator transcription factor [Chloroherpetonaceae bacterium]
MKKIFLIEDDLAIAIALQDALKAEHYGVRHFADGKKGFDATLAESPDLLLLDWMLPTKNGIDICKDLRARGFSAPILMLTSKSDESDKVLGLEFGADDYLAKPFGLRELLARMKALLRRATPNIVTQTVDEIKRGLFSLNLKTRQSHYNQTAIDLLPKEFDMLRFFLEHDGEAVSRYDLLDKVWGVSTEVTTRTIDEHIRKLRKKIGDDVEHPKHIFTIHGFGYRFQSGATT